MRLEVDLTKRIGDYSFSAQFELMGKKHGVFGPSGSGKSTLMALLAGLYKPDQGRIVLDGKVLFDHQKKINIIPARRRIGVVFQHSHLFPHLNVEKNLLYGWQRIKQKKQCVHPAEVIKALDLEDLQHRSVTSLSGGERQRVALGRTLLSLPRLILLDEPLSGLDQDFKFQIIPYLKKALDQFNIPFLFISHSLEEIRLMSDNVLLFGKGPVEQMTPEELARRHLLGGRRGYTNLLHLNTPTPLGDLWSYDWQGVRLILTELGNMGDNLFEVGAKDITLFKQHPEATSARNVLSCQVTDVFADGNRVGVELLLSQGGRLISQIVPESAHELDIQKGTKLVAVIKASAFRRLY